jgi:hypothetical protein
MPHRNLIRRSEKNFLKRMDAGLTQNPLCRFQCAPCKPFATPRFMPKCDRVGRGVESDLMSARMHAGAVRTHVYVSRIARRLHSFDQMKERSRRSVLLLIVMDLPRPCSIGRFILQQVSGGRRETAKYGNARRKIRAPDEARAASIEGGTDRVQMCPLLSE